MVYLCMRKIQIRTMEDWFVKTFLCKTCKQELPLTSFYYWFKPELEKRWRRRSENCKECELDVQKSPAGKKRARDRKQKLGVQKGDKGLEWYLRKKTSDCKKRAKQANLPFDMGYQRLIDLYNKQQGLCYYTDTQMEWNHGRGLALPNSLSIDKLNPELGYTMDNIVMCCHIVNMAKNNRTEQEFYDFCSLILLKQMNRKMNLWG